MAQTRNGDEAVRPAAWAEGRPGGRLRAVVMIAVFDIGGPVAAYSLLRAAGTSPVTALIVSGVFPATGVAIGIVRRRRVDAIGLFVLAGIAVGTALGLTTHDARLVLAEGSVPTALFGLVCLGSLAVRRPLLFRFALEFMGPDSGRGREFAGLWRYESFRRAFGVMTAVWGLAYLLEAFVRVVVVEDTSVTAGLVTSRAMPLVVAAVLSVWTAGYSVRQKRKGERLGQRG